MEAPQEVGGSAFSRRNFLAAGAGVAAVAAGSSLLSACSSGAESTAAATAAASAAAGAGLQAGKKVVFVVHDKNPFFAPVQAGFERFASSMGWEAQFVGPAQFDVQATVDLQANAIQSGAAGLIFTRPDDKAFDANIEAATKAGIPVVLANVASADYQRLNVGFVGQSFIPAGETCGREVSKYAAALGRKDGLILVGNFSPGNSALEERAQGIAQGVASFNQENGTSFTTEVLVTSTDEAKAIGVIDAKYTKEGDAIAGWAMTAFDHQFVGNWAKSKNLVGKFANGGFDLTTPVLDGIKAGNIDFSLGQNPYAQGWISSALLAMQIDPGFPAFFYDTGAEIVDKSNIDVVMTREAAFA